MRLSVCTYLNRSVSLCASLGRSVSPCVFSCLSLSIPLVGSLPSPHSRFPYLTPTTKEAYWYRTMFDELFPERSAEETVMAWTPSFGAPSDPSGRAQAVHEQALTAAAE